MNIVEEQLGLWQKRLNSFTKEGREHVLWAIGRLAELEVAAKPRDEVLVRTLIENYFPDQDGKHQLFQVIGMQAYQLRSDASVRESGSED